MTCPDLLPFTGSLSLDLLVIRCPEHDPSCFWIFRATLPALQEKHADYVSDLGKFRTHLEQVRHSHHGWARDRDVSFISA